MWLGVKFQGMEYVRGPVGVNRQALGPWLEVDVSLRDTEGGAESSLEEEKKQHSQISVSRDREKINWQLFYRLIMLFVKQKCQKFTGCWLFSLSSDSKLNICWDYWADNTRHWEAVMRIFYNYVIEKIISRLIAVAVPTVSIMKAMLLLPLTHTKSSLSSIYQSYQTLYYLKLCVGSSGDVSLRPRPT